jgi:peptidoglycan hydrolase-like protein with peptidoglycan-binding domain
VLSMRISVAMLICAGAFTAPAFASRTHHPTTSGKLHHSRRMLPTHARSHRLHGQQSIAPERVTQIQQALIREHYLTGDASGQWDSTTLSAMQKYQADQGWQTKLMPDSRALKKLGLGPDYSNALNAKNSTFAAPPSDSTIPAAQNAGFTSASGVNQ